MLFTTTKSSPSKSPPSNNLDGVKVVHSLKARRLALRVDTAKGVICLVIPRRVSEKRAWEFAHANLSWIEARLAKLHKPVPFEHGSQIPVFGTPRTINVTRATGRTTHITLGDDTLDVQTSRPDPANNIRRYLYDTLQSIMRPMAEEKAARIGKTIAGLTLRDTSTRWGSCSPDGNLMLCWRLIFAPMDVIDYVVAHEVAHLKHMDHSQRFWDTCESLTAGDMDAAKKWLNTHGESLLKYGTRS